MINRASPDQPLHELELEAGIGELGVQDMTRAIPVIDLSNFDERRHEISEALWEAATEAGFFQVINHGIDLGQATQAFELAQQFFALEENIKTRYALHGTDNVGWEYKTQVRPSTGVADEKESFQITLSRMQDYWPRDTELPGFRQFMQDFEHECWQLGMRILSCFADRLGFERDFFAHAHDPSSPHYASTLRLLHYLPQASKPKDNGLHWRAGAHTDFDCLTLLFQRDGQDGLQVCPGFEADSARWTPVSADATSITCNIGDMLMRWSDDLLRSTLHRVQTPPGEAARDARYSIAFFCQANGDQLIQGPESKYAPIRADQYLKQRLSANFTSDEY